MRISAPPRGKAGAWTTDKPAALLAGEGERERQHLSQKKAWTWLLSAPEVSRGAVGADGSQNPQPFWITTRPKL